MRCLPAGHSGIVLSPSGFQEAELVDAAAGAQQCQVQYEPPMLVQTC